jgi:protein-S-isoprenylcysteine O-methyltransferase Ste14
VSRFAVTAIFVLLATATAVGVADAVGAAVEDPGARTAAVTGYTALKLAVVLAFSFFVFVREPSRRPARDPVALAACVVAVVAVVLLQEPPASASTPLVVAGDLVTLGACAWLLASVLALGRCFGVLPEVRGLVTRGPYRVVRHPIYLGELGACAGLVLAAPTAWNAVVALLFAVAQGARMRFEEAALAAEFPEYRAYAARTPRLVPRVVGLRLPGYPSARRV